MEFIDILARAVVDDGYTLGQVALAAQGLHVFWSVLSAKRDGGNMISLQPRILSAATETAVVVHGKEIAPLACREAGMTARATAQIAHFLDAGTAVSGVPIRHPAILGVFCERLKRLAARAHLAVLIPVRLSALSAGARRTTPGGAIAQAHVTQRAAIRACRWNVGDTAAHLHVGKVGRLGASSVILAR